MANLISDADKAAYKSALNDVHDTFSRPITVWKNSAQEVTSQDSNFDAFTDQGIKNVVYTPESRTFRARVKYIDKQEKEFGLALADASSRANTSLDITQEFQLVRI